MKSVELLDEYDKEGSLPKQLHNQHFLRAPASEFSRILLFSVDWLQNVVL